MKCKFKGEDKRKEETKMEKTLKGLKIGLMIGLMSLAASPALARSISLKEAGLDHFVGNPYQRTNSLNSRR